MVAIPVKTNTDQSAVAPLFGKAKWFALIGDEGSVSYWNNTIKSGREVVNHLIAAGVTDVLVQEIGANPFAMLQQAGIQVHHAGTGRVLYVDAHAAFVRGELEAIAMENGDGFVEKSKQRGAEAHGGRHHAHRHQHAGRHH